MTTTTNEHTRRHGGWQRRRAQGRAAPARTAAAHEPLEAEAAEAQWLDDGGAAQERSDRPSMADSDSVLRVTFR